MAQNGNKRNDRRRSDMRPHDGFLELCAVSTTGELTEDEQNKLREHLATCFECREALKEFETTANIGAPLLSAELTSADSRDQTSAAASTPMVEAFPARILDMKNSQSGSNLAEGKKESILAHRNGVRRAQLNWTYVWMPLAAAILLTAALGIYSYQAGRRHAPQLIETTSVRVDGKLDALEQRLSDASHDREVLKAQLAEQDQTIRDLRRQITSESAVLNNAKNAQANLENSLEDALSQKQQMAQQQSTAAQNLDAAQASLRKMQAQLDSLQQQRDQDGLLDASLEAQIKDLNLQLRQSEQTIGKQQDLLADDRDIRDLMGARDLYIAEVYDVARDGATQKPYGRVFYTKGKSLIFYAYDLDHQPGVKNASTFQAWGQSGPDRQQVLNLGIFYQDSAAKKRWVLKFDDPRALEEINAVFVTVEPHGGSHKPSGKRLLFASLRIEPNHP
jgi:hypothetical protein